MAQTLLLAALFVLQGWLAIHAEKHYLHYTYTAISKPINRQGIHEFTAMGILDGKEIDYFDSDTQEKVPKQSWMKMDPSYWEKGTQSRKSKQQWFKVNINILKERFRQNDSDIHVLQWMHGCAIDTDPHRQDIVHGVDTYSYDGSNFLSFDEENEIWVAPSRAAIETKAKWDKVQVLKEYTKSYLKKECVSWLQKFLDSQTKDGDTAKPDVYMFSTDAKVQTNTMVTCMATGFSLMNTNIQIKRDGRVLTEDDGVKSSGVRPNGDGTFQRRDHVEIRKNDESKYTCEVIHALSRLHIVKELDKKSTDVDTVKTMIVVMSVVFVVVIIGIILIVVKKRVCNSGNNRPAPVPDNNVEQELLRPADNRPAPDNDNTVEPNPSDSNNSLDSGHSSAGNGSLESEVEWRSLTSTETGIEAQ